VVDVGGSHGAISLALAEGFPDLRFVVHDLHSVISESSAFPENAITSRISVMTHDFFTLQPFAGAGVYYYRCIFHGCAQGYVVRKLRTLIPALKKGAFVMINDFCVTDRSTVCLEDRRVR
ncbi:S-adenosyl-L-methionine-dependent methyltransferase, partial [Periconia macrospinosa]